MAGKRKTNPAGSTNSFRGDGLRHLADPCSETEFPFLLVFAVRAADDDPLDVLARDP
jgi:hypothetical protein